MPQAFSFSQQFGIYLNRAMVLSVDFHTSEFHEKVNAMEDLLQIHPVPTLPTPKEPELS